MFLHRLLILLLILISLSVTSAATEVSHHLIIHSADHIKHLEEAQLLRAQGNVELEYGAMRLKADYVKVDFAERVASAEGNVTVYYGEEKFYGTSLVYDLDTELWTLMQPETTLRHWFIKGDSLRMIEDRVYIVERVSITCLCQPPCYRITAREVKVHLQERLRAYHSIFWVGGIPLFCLPIYERSLRDVVVYPNYGVPRRFVVRPGYDAGWFLWTYYNWYMNPELRGRFYMDFFENPGTGIGFDVEYQTKDGEGIFYIYSAHPTDKERARWKLHMRHRERITEDTVGLLSVDSFSDAAFNIDFERGERWRRFTREELDAQRRYPKGSLSLLQIKPDYALRLYTRIRLNDWVSPFTERIPELSFDLFRQRVGNTPFFWDVDGNTARLRHFPSKESVTQANINFEISRPGSVRWLRLEPALRTRGFWYSRDRLGRKSVYMGNYEVSLGAHTRLYSPPVRFGYHIFKPRLTYHYSPPPPIERGDLFGFVDKLPDKKDFFELGIDNTFIRWLDDERKAKFAELNLRTRFHRDGRQIPWDKLLTELNLWPADGVSIRGWTKYDLNVGRLKKIEASLSWHMTPDWKVALSGNYNWTDARFEEWEVGFTRRIHCWKIHFSLEGELDETRVFIGFELAHILDHLVGAEVQIR